MNTGEESKIWKDIIGFDGLYRISNYGQLHILPRLRNGRIYKERYSIGSKDCYGYLRTTLTDENHIRHDVKMHQLVAIHFVDNPNNYTVVNHDDGVKDNNYYKNLKWSTLSENNKHAYEVLGKSLKGANNGRATLTDDEVKHIKALSRDSTTDKVLAKHYRTRPQNIQSIRLGWTWKHITA
jgi:hypothetical protein